MSELLRGERVALRPLEPSDVDRLPAVDPLDAQLSPAERELTAADALFLALAEQLDEPLATRDEALADEAAKHCAVAVVPLRG